MACKCAQCWTLAEYMQARTDKDYGLEPAPGHGHGLKVIDEAPSSMTDLNAVELARLQHMARKRQSSFPWEENAA